MKLKDIVVSPYIMNVDAPRVKIRNMYKNKDAGKKKKVRTEKVVIQDTKTGKIYGQRAVIQKSTGSK